MQLHAAFLIYEAKPWDEARGRIHPPSDAPSALQQLQGYALHLSGGTLDLSTVRERVIIVDRVRTAREIGMVGTEYSSAGIYQRLKTGQLAILLPWGDKDKRRKRSEMWKQWYAHALSRAIERARQPPAAFDWGRRVLGDGPEAAEALSEMLRVPQPLAVDVETVGDMPDIQITAIGIASRTCSVSVPWAGYISRVFGHERGLTNPVVGQLVRDILGSPSHAKVFHNGGFDRAVFSALGMPCLGEFEDTILAMKIVFPELYRGLQFAAGMAADVGPWKDAFKAIRAKALAEHATEEAGLLNDWHEIPIGALLDYNSKDAAATILLHDYLAPRLAKTHLGAVKYAKLRSLADMAAGQWQGGVAIDLGRRNELMAKGRKDLAALVRKWRSIVGPGIPPYGRGVKKQLAKLFFETWKAPVIVRSEATSEPSLNTFTLTCWDVAGRQPLSDAAFTLFRIRKLQKNLQAFLGPLDKDRVHAQPNVTGTVGTRFSYQKPNLQQWAKDQKTTRFTTGEKVNLAPNVRELVVADPGCVLIEADYNALEARAVAYRTSNLMWFDWMAKGQDMHVQHVGLMYGHWLHRKGCTKHGCDGAAHYCAGTNVHDDWADPDGLRQVTKVTTYARFYNEKGNPDPVVRMLKSKMPTLTTEAVDEVFEKFDAAIPHIARWHAEARKSDARNRFIETGLGGWRLPVGDRVDANRNRSFEIQSTVGDVVCTAMLLLRDMLDASRGQRFLFQVHDAFIVQCREEDLLEVASKVKTAMEWTIPLLWEHKNVVFPVDAKAGKNWAGMKAIHGL